MSGEWLKKNAVLIAGIVLPLVVCAIFGAALIVSRASSEPPKHAFIFAADWYENNNDKYVRIRLKVEDGKVIVQDMPETAENKYSNRPKLYVYEPATNRPRRIAYEDAAKDNEGRYQIKELADITVDTAEVAPDGYRFTGHSYSSGYREPLGGFLFGASYRYACTLEKDGYRHRIQLSDNASCYGHKFLGWVKP